MKLHWMFMFSWRYHWCSTTVLSYQEVLRMCKVSELDWCGVDLNNSKLDVSPPGCIDRLYKHCRGSVAARHAEPFSAPNTGARKAGGAGFQQLQSSCVVWDESEEMTVGCTRDVRCPSSPLHLGFPTGFWAPGTVTWVTDELINPSASNRFPRPHPVSGRA